MFIMLVGSFGMNLNATVAMVPLLDLYGFSSASLHLCLSSSHLAEITAVQSAGVRG